MTTTTIPTLLTNHSGTPDIDFMRGWATHLGGYLLRHGRHIRNIEIFGSIARGDATINSDFDLIILVDDALAKFWAQRINELLWEGSLDTYSALTAKNFRFMETMGLLGLDEIVLWDAVGINSDKIDMFVYPTDWRSRKTLLQQVGHHHDPRFVHNIAQDARWFVPDLGFVWPAAEQSTGTTSA